MKFIVWRARNHPFLIFCSFSYNKIEENFSMFLPKKILHKTANAIYFRCGNEEVILYHHVYGRKKKKLKSVIITDLDSLLFLLTLTGLLLELFQLSV